MAAIILYALSLAANVLAWNQDGHRLVATLAASRLNGKGEDFIRQHMQIPDGTVTSALAVASTWADDIVETRPETGRLHFVNTPYRDCQSYEAVRDCEEGECIVSAITRYSQMAANLDASKIDRSEAIMFLIHLMADIHQPLHVSFRLDAGGTKIALGSPDLSLHEVWDRIPAGLDPKMLPADSSQSIDFENPIAVEAWAASIASETGTKFTCKAAYRHVGADALWVESGDTINEEYLKRQKIVVNIQLARAANRLAGLLNDLGAIFMREYYERNPRPVYVAPTPLVEEAAVSNRFAVLEMDGDFDEDAFVARDLNEVVTVAPVMRRPVYQPEMFAGIDLAGLVLLKHPNMRHLVVTSRLLRRSGLANMAFVVVEVKFKNRQRSVPFAFDTACFGRGPHSFELVGRVLSAIRRLPYAGPCHQQVDSVAPAYEQSQLNGTLFFNHFAIIGGPRISIADLKSVFSNLIIMYHIRRQLEEEQIFGKDAVIVSATQLGSHQDEIVPFQFGQVHFFTTVEALRAPGDEPIHVSLRWVLVSSVLVAHLVDKRLCSGQLTHETSRQMIAAGNANVRKGLKAQIQFRPRLGNELSNLNTYFFGDSPDRWAAFDAISTLLVVDGGKTLSGNMEMIWTASNPLAPIVRRIA